MTRQTAYQKRHREKGLCLQCSRKAVKYVNIQTGKIKVGARCQRCLTINRKWKRLMTGSNSHEESGRGRPPIA